MSAGHTVDTFSYIPSVHIGLTLPTGTRNSYLGATGIEDNWHKENFRKGDAVPLTGPLISQEFDLRAFIYPSTLVYLTIAYNFLYLEQQIETTTRIARLFLQTDKNGYTQQIG
jgi:hypothetical protein